LIWLFWAFHVNETTHTWPFVSGFFHSFIVCSRLVRVLNSLLFFFFFGTTGTWTEALILATQVLYHLRHSASPWVSFYCQIFHCMKYHIVSIYQFVGIWLFGFCE
jgi:hypothetical protein